MRWRPDIASGVLEFWRRVADSEPIGPDFRRLAVEMNRRLLEA
jgi:hypothetical protein